MLVGNATISVGVSTAILTLPGVKFTNGYIFVEPSSRQKNSDDFGDDTFSMRTSLRLTVKLGPDSIMEPLK